MLRFFPLDWIPRPLEEEAVSVCALSSLVFLVPSFFTLTLFEALVPLPHIPPHLIPSVTLAQPGVRRKENPAFRYIYVELRKL